MFLVYFPRDRALAARQKLKLPACHSCQQNFVVVTTICDMSRKIVNCILPSEVKVTLLVDGT